MKILKIFILILFIVINLGFSYNKVSKYEQYVGKNIKIITLYNNVYEGTLIYIYTIDLCQRYDATTGSCVDYIYFHTLILLLNNNYLLPIPEDIIITIQD